MILHCIRITLTWHQLILRLRMRLNWTSRQDSPLKESPAWANERIMNYNRNSWRNEWKWEPIERFFFERKKEKKNLMPGEKVE